MAQFELKRNAPFLSNLMDWHMTSLSKWCILFVTDWPGQGFLTGRKGKEFCWLQIDLFLSIFSLQNCV